MRGHRRNGGFGFGPAAQGSHGRGRARHHGAGLTLDLLRPHDEVEIVTIGDEQARMQALRFGMAEGSRATCVTRIPAGPIVMQSGRQEIAVGRRLASRICVRRCEGDAEQAS